MHAFMGSCEPTQSARPLVDVIDYIYVGIACIDVVQLENSSAVTLYYRRVSRG